MSRLALLSCWLVLLTAIAVIYRPGLNGPLIFDDTPNIVDNSALRIADLSPASLYKAAMSGRASEFRRPLSMLTFGVNYALNPSSTYALKITNVVIHLVNALLAGLLTLILVRSYPCFTAFRDRAPAISLVVAAAWALHPLQVSTVLYTVQRMTLLSTLFTLAALIAYAGGRLRQQRGARGLWLLLLSVLVFMPLAFLSKETGILFFGYVLVIELFGAEPAAPGAKARLNTRLLLAVAAIGAAAAAFYIARNSTQYAASYLIKGFSATERLLTEPRVLIWYLRMIVFPDIREMGLTHDDWLVSHSILQPPSTLVAIAALVAAIAALPWLRTHRPALGFCIAWFLAGHSIEAGPLPLDLVYEHRNYLPSLAVFIGIACLGVHALGRAGRAARLAPAIAVAVLLTLSAMTGLRIYEWRNPAHWAIAQTTHHPRSAFSFLDLGSVYATTLEQLTDESGRKMFFERADAAFVEASRLNPRLANGPVSRIVMRLRAQEEVPQALFDDVTRILKVGAMPASSQSALIGLLDCALDGRCPLTLTQFMALVNSALENPDCPGFLSSQLLALAAEYYGTKEKDIRMAITMAKAATEVPKAPIALWFGLIRWLSAGGYFAQAREALDELDRLDRMGQFTRERREIRQSLETALNSGDRSPNADPSPAP